MSVVDIFQKAIEFDESAVVHSVEAEIVSGSEVSSILNHGLIATMDEVGQRFSQGDLFVPEML